MAVFLGIFFALLAIGSAGAFAFCLWTKNKRGGSKTVRQGMAISPVLFVAFLLLFIFIPFGLKTVTTGEVGVVKVFGEVKEVKQPGMHFINIATTKIDKYDIKTREIGEDIEAYSFDAQTMTASLSVQYNIHTDKVLDIAKVYGSVEALDARMRAAIIEKAKVILSSKSGMKLIEERSTLSGLVEDEIRKGLVNYPVTITLVAVKDIAFNAAFENAVEQKMIAEQDKLKAQYDKEKAIIKAEEELEVAKLQAEQAIAKAKGEAEAKAEAAKGEARALKLKSVEVARMLGFTIIEITDPETSEIVEYEIDMAGKTADEIKVISDYLKFIAYLETWDGKLPEVIGDGSTLGGIVIGGI